MLAPVLLILLISFSPLLLISSMLRFLAFNTLNPSAKQENKKKCRFFTPAAKLFLTPVALILSAVQQSILGEVINHIGLGSQLKWQEKLAWNHIRDLDGIEEFGYRISKKHPELFGEPVVVNVKGRAKQRLEMGRTSHIYRNPHYRNAWLSLVVLVVRLLVFALRSD